MCYTSVHWWFCTTTKIVNNCSFDFSKTKSSSAFIQFCREYLVWSKLKTKLKMKTENETEQNRKQKYDQLYLMHLPYLYILSALPSLPTESKVNILNWYHISDHTKLPKLMNLWNQHRSTPHADCCTFVTLSLNSTVSKYQKSLHYKGIRIQCGIFVTNIQYTDYWVRCCTWQWIIDANIPKTTSTQLE